VAHCVVEAADGNFFAATVAGWLRNTGTIFKITQMAR
jgi:hypothetical protein